MRRIGAMVAVALLATPALHGCADEASAGGTLVVMGPWVDDKTKPGQEADIFQAVLDGYEKQLGVDIQYQGTRAIGQVLRAKIKDGTLPDIAIMPNVGELAEYATEDLARPVTAVVPQEHRVPVEDGTTVVNHRGLWRSGEAYAVAIKTDLKSLIIYEKDNVTPPQPKTLAEMETMTGTDTWCLGLSAASVSGWPGTDWIEDLVLHQSGPSSYQEWASGRPLDKVAEDDTWTAPTVRAAFQRFGKVAGDVAHRKEALLTTPEEAAAGLLPPGDSCVAMHQSSYYAGDTGEVYPVPAEKSATAVEVSGDFAARFTDNPAAEQLLKLLAGGREWVDAGAVFPIDPDVNRYAGPRQAVAGILADAPLRCLDASDAMPTTMATAFQNAVLEYVADPTRLDAILRRLQEVRNQVPSDQRLRVFCST